MPKVNTAPASLPLAETFWFDVLFIIVVELNGKKGSVEVPVEMSVAELVELPRKSPSSS